VKAFDPNVSVKFFKSTIKANGEIDDEKLLICLVLPSKTLYLTGVTITWEIAQIIFL
jgi:hypothetical protein